MDEQDKITGENQEKAAGKPAWQVLKESWYDKIPLSLKQMDIIVTICWILIALTVVGIILDAADIYHLFG